MTSRTFAIFGPFLLPMLLLGGLEWAAHTFLAHSDTIASPSAAALALWQAAEDGSLWEATGFTLLAAGTGLLLGAVAGLSLGIIMGLSRTVASAGFLSVEILRALPSVALIPLAMLLFGFGLSMEVSVVAFATFWPILLLAQSAARRVDPRLMEVSTALELSPLARTWKIVLPAMLPHIFVALRLGVAIALVVAITVEIVANPHGAGYALIIAQQTLDPAGMLAWLAWIGILGVAINAIAEWLQGLASRRMGGVR